MDRVVNDDSLAEVSAKPGEILHIQIGVRVHTVLPVESVVEVLPLRVDQLQALISIPLLCSCEENNFIKLGYFPQEFLHKWSDGNEDVPVEVCWLCRGG
jgi:hypothetical protein